MDRATYIQLDRIEQTCNEIKTFQEMNQIDSRETIIEFYKSEVETEDGNLGHLRNDKRLLDFVNSLQDEIDNENKNENEPKLRNIGLDDDETN